jgi:hypothetical protein
LDTLTVILNKMEGDDTACAKHRSVARNPGTLARVQDERDISIGGDTLHRSPSALGHSADMTLDTRESFSV